MNIIVIHGFNSGPGKKSEILKNNFPDAKIFSPQLNNDPLSDIYTIQSYINKHKDIHIVGTSLGGFYTLYLSLIKDNLQRDDLHFYSINPSIEPFDRFSPKLNQTFQNYKTKEKFTISEKFLGELKLLQDTIQEDFNPDPNMNFYFGLLDEVIDHAPTIKKLYSIALDHNTPINIFTDYQGHRYNDLSLVINSIKENMVL